MKKTTIQIDDPMRGTGRTTARMLHAIAEALEHPDQWVTFKDHRDYRRAMCLYYAECIQSIARALHLTIEAGQGPDKVLVRSPISRILKKKTIQSRQIGNRK